MSYWTIHFTRFSIPGIAMPVHHHMTRYRNREQAENNVKMLNTVNPSFNYWLEETVE